MPHLTVGDNLLIGDGGAALGFIGARRAPSARATRSTASAATHIRFSVRFRSSARRPAARRDRQGGPPQAAPAHSRRSDLGADGRARREGLRRHPRAARRGLRDPVHLAPHVRDRRRRRPHLRFPQRAAHRDLRCRRAQPRCDDRADDRPAAEELFPPRVARAASSRRAASRVPRPALGPGDSTASTSMCGRARSSGSAASTGRGSSTLMHAVFGVLRAARGRDHARRPRARQPDARPREGARRRTSRSCPRIARPRA